MLVVVGDVMCVRICFVVLMMVILSLRCWVIEVVFRLI